MSCTRCYDLCVSYPARTPGELRKAVAIVASNTADGTLIEVAPGPSSGYETRPFEPIATGAEWPDTFNFWFECTQCGERFSLQADTYRGGGGTWQPARAAAIHDVL